MPGQPGHYTRPHDRMPTLFTGHGCKNDSTTERNVDSQATWVIYILCLFLTCYPWVFFQPGTGRFLVDWCRNSMYVLYAVNSSTIGREFTIQENLVKIQVTW